MKKMLPGPVMQSGKKEKKLSKKLYAIGESPT